MRKLIHAKIEAQPEKTENAFGRGRFAALLSLALAAATAGQNGTNINDFRDNKSMAPTQKAPAQANVEAQQQAVTMISALKEFVLTGNTQAKIDFETGFKANMLNANNKLNTAFLASATAELKKQMGTDPALAQIVTAWNKINGPLTAATFVGVVENTGAPQQAVKMVAAFREFVLAGNEQKKTEFKAIFDANPSAAFVKAMTAEFKKSVVADPKLGPMVEAWKKTYGGFDATTFLAFVDNARASVNDPALYEQLKKSGPDITKGVLDPLVAIYAAPLIESATVAAGTFVGMLSAYKKSDRESAADALRKELTKCTTSNGEFVSGFYVALAKTLKDQSPEAAAILSAYMKDKNITKMNAGNFSKMLDEIVVITQNIYAPPYSMASLQAKYGAGFAPAVSAFVSAQKAAATQSEQMTDLKENIGARLANAKKYATENGLLDAKVGAKTLGDIIGEWEKRMAEAKTLKNLQALNAEVPGMQTLHYLELRIGTSQRLLDEAINGDAGKNQFYVTMGANAWVRNVQAQVATLRNLQNDALQGKFATAMLAKRNLNVKDLEGFLDAVASANTNMSAMLTSLDAFLASETNPTARMMKVGETFGTVRLQIATMAEKLKPLRPRSTEDELKAEIDRRFMIQFIAVPLSDRTIDRVAKLEEQYSAMAQDEKFIDFRRNFSSDLNQYVSLLQGNASPTNAERMNMASQALALFRSVESANRAVSDAKTKVMAIQTDGTALMEAIKGNVAFGMGVASNGDDAMVQALKSGEVTRALSSAYGISINMTGQPTMDMVITQLNSMVKPPNNIPSTLTPEQQANVQRFISSLQNMRQQVNNIMNGVNTAQPPSISLQYAYGAYTALTKRYGADWRKANSEEDMAKVCSFIVGYSTLPPAYGALAAEKTCESLLKSFDEASIGLITRAIASYSQPMVQGEYYDMLMTYYDVVSGRISKMFTDISTVRRGRLEDNEDVRIRTPSEAPEYADMYIPSINLTVRIYKKIYEQWESNGVLRVNRSTNITEGPGGTPYFLNVASSYMDRRLVEAGVNLPRPAIWLPLVLRSISVLAPATLPPVGEALRRGGSLDMSYQSTTVERSLDRGAAYGTAIALQPTTTVGGVAAPIFTPQEATVVGNILSQIAHNNTKKQLDTMSQSYDAFQAEFENGLTGLPIAEANAIRSKEAGDPTVYGLFQSSLGNFTTKEKSVSSAFDQTATVTKDMEGGMSTLATERYTLSQGTGQDKVETGAIEVTNLVIPHGKEGARKPGDYYLVRDVRFDMRNVNDKNQAISALFSGTWPAGATDAAYLERHVNYDGSTYFEMYTYHRDPSGSFGGAETRTLTADEAKSLYWGPYQSTMQKLYAGGAYKRGDFLSELDGAVLFSGAFTGKESVSLKQLQGVGGALEPVERYGASVDYEHTRNGRTTEAFIRRDPKNLRFWVGRFTAENLQVDEDGQRRFYGELQYLEANKADVRGFISMAKNSGGTSFWNTAQGAFIAQGRLWTDILGMRYGGIGAGRMLTETEEMGGGKIYGVSEDMLKGLVASALYTKYKEDNLAGTQYGNDLKTMLISFGVRNMFLQGLEAGAGWEVLQNEGAGFLKYQWGPVSATLSKVELGAYMLTKDKQFYPMLGKYMEWTPGEGGARVSNEAYAVLPAQGIGDEVRLRSTPFSFALGGGVISHLGGGGHLGLMFPMRNDWQLGMFSAVGQDVYTDMALTQGEFMVGGIHTLARGSGEGLRLNTTTISLSGIEQGRDPRLTGPEGNAGQMDLVFGMRWYDAGRGSSLDANIGGMIWGTKLSEDIDSTTTRTRDGMEIAATLGLSYKTMSLGSRLMDPTLSITGRLGMQSTGETIETPLDKTISKADKVDWKISIKASTDIGYKPKK